MILTQNLAIDLGSSNTLVYAKSKGIILREPSVVAVDLRRDDSNVIAVGKEAKEMMGRTPGSITAKRPLKNGVISDYDMTADMLRILIKKASGMSLFNRCKVILSIPSGVTEVERRAVHEAARNAGAKEVSLVEAPMAAAIGANLPVMSAQGTLIADLGGGTCEVAVVSLGDEVATNSIRVGGDDMDDAIIGYIRKKFSLLIGVTTAEELKIKIGSAFPSDNEKSMVVKGRNLTNGLPGSATVTSANIREAIGDVTTKIVELICETLEKTPPELSSDIVTSGITLTGALAQLTGLDMLIKKATNIPVTVAKNPSDCTVNGLGYLLTRLGK